MSYEGIFIRDYVGETPDSTNGTSWTCSPDIICTGSKVLDDPLSWTNKANYDKGEPNIANQTPLQLNNVYIRGINNSNTARTAVIYLYYVDTSIVLWPQNWKTVDIQYNNAQQNWVKVSVDTLNQIVGTNPPFLWRPPRQGIHYCLVAWVKNGEDQDTPPELYKIGAVNDMANFILTNRNVGWRNTIEVDGTQPTIQDTAAIIGPPDGGILNIGVQCDKLPTDGTISFTVPGPDPENSINFIDRPIISENYAPTLKVQWPANFNSTLTFTYKKGKTDPPDGANIIPLVGTRGTGSDFIEHVKTIAPNRLANVHFYGHSKDFHKNVNKSVPPMKLFIVGSVPFILKK